MRRIAVWRSNGEPSGEDFPLSKNLMYYLTRDVSTTYVSGGQVDENAKAVYKEVVHFAVGKELEKAKLSRSSHKETLLERFRKNKKFQDIIGPMYKLKGEGYRSLAQKPFLYHRTRLSRREGCLFF
jgi:hypothetical protein